MADAGPGLTVIGKLSELVSEHGATLTMTLAAGCRCMGCSVYQIEMDNRKIQEDSLVACIATAYNLISKPDKG